MVEWKKNTVPIWVNFVLTLLTLPCSLYCFNCLMCWWLLSVRRSLLHSPGASLLCTFNSTIIGRTEAPKDVHILIVLEPICILLYLEETLQTGLKLKTLKWADHYNPSEPSIIPRSWACRESLWRHVENCSWSWRWEPGEESRQPLGTGNVPLNEHSPADCLNLPHWVSLVRWQT